MRYGFIVFLLLSPIVLGQSFESAPIMPEDLGAYKWVMKSTPGVGEVAFYRVERTEIGPGGALRRREISDTVVSPAAPGEVLSKTAFFYNPGVFDQPRGVTWHYSIPGSGGTITGKVHEYSLGPKKAEIVFRDSESVTTRMVFTVFNLLYDKAKAIHPGLPEMKENSGWSWRGYLEERQE